MKLCFIADARSPIAKNFISYFVRRGDEVSVISSYPCDVDEIPGARIFEIPLALSSLARVRQSGDTAGRRRPGLSRLLAELHIGELSELPSAIRRWWGLLELPRKAAQAAAILSKVEPDLVHAMRLPFEGMLASMAAGDRPLLISIWGNDLTLHAARYPRVGILTTKALRRTQALHCDCERDLRLAKTWGFDPAKPSRVFPSAGGIQSDFYFAVQPDMALLSKYNIPRGVPLIINPRGFRGYVRNDTFFRSVPIVLERFPRAFFLAPGMENNPIAERWIRELRITRSVRLLPVLSREQLAVLFRMCEVSVSPSSHDGTPNTLLEAMAVGCFPVVGNVESVREWIVDGENGLVCDETDPESLAACVVRALQSPELRRMAAGTNRQIILDRADYPNIMEQVRSFYGEILRSQRTDEPADPTCRNSGGPQCAALPVS